MKREPRSSTPGRRRPRPGSPPRWLTASVLGLALAVVPPAIAPAEIGTAPPRPQEQDDGSAADRLDRQLKLAWEEVDRYNEAPDADDPDGAHPARRWAERLWSFRAEAPGTAEATRATREALHLLVHSGLAAEIERRVDLLAPEDPAWPGVLEVLSEHARRSDDPSLALDSARRLLEELDGREHRTTRQRAALISGLLLEGRGEKERALELLEAAVKFDPESRDAASARREIRDLTELAVGMEAPRFSAATLRGGQLSSGDLRGKIVLLDFWSTT